MVALYIRRVLEGTTTYNNVPARYKEAVKAGLEAKVASGEITQDKLDEILGTK